MTRFKKPALLAGGLAAALLFSTGLANAAPGRDDYGTRDRHEQSSHDNYRDRHDSDRQDNRDRDGRSYYHADYDHARYRDSYHRPPMRIEYRTYAPHPGMRWHAGEWRWQNGQWVWFAGTWLMAAAILSH